MSLHPGVRVLVGTIDQVDLGTEGSVEEISFGIQRFILNQRGTAYTKSTDGLMLYPEVGTIKEDSKVIIQKNTK